MYEFSLERHETETHLLQAIDGFVDLGGVWAHLAPFYRGFELPGFGDRLSSSVDRCSRAKSSDFSNVANTALASATSAVFPPRTSFATKAS
jgi:hypothetical protein